MVASRASEKPGQQQRVNCVSLTPNWKCLGAYIDARCSGKDIYEYFTLLDPQNNYR